MDYESEINRTEKLEKRDEHCVLYITILPRTPALAQNVRPIPFWSFLDWYKGNWSRGGSIALNIVLFIPLGYLLSGVWKSKNTHSDTYRVYYDYYICYVTLENFNLSHLPIYIMGEDQLSRYALYMATLGNSILVLQCVRWRM